MLDNLFFTADTMLLDTVIGMNCPTIRFRNVSFLPSSDTIVEIMYCQDKVFTTSTDTLTNDGIAHEIFQSALGCDSGVTYDVSFFSRPIQITNYAVCYGDSVLIGDEYYYEEIMFTDTFFGDICDTTFTYVLNFYNPDTGRMDYLLPFGETLTINNELFTVAGEYEQILPGNITCDSVLLINIEEGVNEEFVYPNIFSPNADNINDKWILNLINYPENEVNIYDRWGNRVA
jgi:hypothetical protein